MPGSRLSYDDRRRIAAGLLEGLGYAEIARQLDRPTSTISREVARNGGPGSYRADRAQLSTERRARRRSPLTLAVVPETGTSGRDPAAVHSFLERFTEVMLRNGLPRMAARVLASLYATDAGSLTAAELVGRLRVSPASISKAVGYLEELGLVRRERDTLRRRERYVIDDDVWMRAWEVSTRATVAWADVAHEGAEAFGTDTPAGARLKDMHAFFDELARDMVQVADHWQRFRATRQAR